MTERSERTYLFDMGDSGSGPIGYCARVDGRTREEALDRLQTLLPLYGGEIELRSRDLGDTLGHNEYINVYFGHADVEDATDPECPECGQYLPEEENLCRRCNTLCNWGEYHAAGESCSEPTNDDDEFCPRHQAEWDAEDKEAS